MTRKSKRSKPGKLVIKTRPVQTPKHRLYQRQPSLQFQLQPLPPQLCLLYAAPSPEPLSRTTKEKGSRMRMDVSIAELPDIELLSALSRLVEACQLQLTGSRMER